MARAISLFSSENITEDAVGELMEFLGAEKDHFAGWKLVRNNKAIFVEPPLEEMADLPPEMLQNVAAQLGSWPVSRYVVLFNHEEADALEYRMVRAVAMAMAEQWPIVMDDHAGLAEIIYPPGQRPKD